MPKGKKGKKAKAEAAAAPAKDEVPVPQPGMRLQATFEADGKFYVAEVLEVGVKVASLALVWDESDVANWSDATVLHMLVLS